MLKDTIMSSTKNKLAGAILKKDLAEFAKRWTTQNTVVPYY